MRGMSVKAKLGWVLALAIGFLAVMAVISAQPSWGAEQQAGHANHEVHYYFIYFACAPDLLHCVKRPTEKYDTVEECMARLLKARRFPERLAIPGYPALLGRCRSWSPPFNEKQLKG